MILDGVRDDVLAEIRERIVEQLADEVAVEDLSIHTPDLDDVFFALTGNPSKEQIP